MPLSLESSPKSWKAIPWSGIGILSAAGMESICLRIASPTLGGNQLLGSGTRYNPWDNQFAVSTLDSSKAKQNHVFTILKSTAMDHGKGEEDIGHLILVDISCFQKNVFQGKLYIPWIPWAPPAIYAYIWLLTLDSLVISKLGVKTCRFHFSIPTFLGGWWSDYISFGSKRRHGCQALKTYIWFPAYI